MQAVSTAVSNSINIMNIEQVSCICIFTKGDQEPGLAEHRILFTDRTNMNSNVLAFPNFKFVCLCLMQL